MSRAHKSEQRADAAPRMARMSDAARTRGHRGRVAWVVAGVVGCLALVAGGVLVLRAGEESTRSTAPSSGQVLRLGDVAVSEDEVRAYSLLLLGPRSSDASRAREQIVALAPATAALLDAAAHARRDGITVSDEAVRERTESIETGDIASLDALLADQAVSRTALTRMAEAELLVAAHRSAIAEDIPSPTRAQELAAWRENRALFRVDPSRVVDVVWAPTAQASALAAAVADLRSGVISFEQFRREVSARAPGTVVSVAQRVRASDPTGPVPDVALDAGATRGEIVGPLRATADRVAYVRVRGPLEAARVRTPDELGEELTAFTRMRLRDARYRARIGAPGRPVWAPEWAEDARRLGAASRATP